MLIIHGTADSASPIHRHLRVCDGAKRTHIFELKVYYGPHGFMLANGQLRQDEIALDAFRQMAIFPASWYDSQFLKNDFSVGHAIPCPYNM
jgi:hypothetical protein